MIAGLLSVVEAELAAQAGRVASGQFAVIAMGKLGGREMTASSDLDLIFVFDALEGVESSDGASPMPVTVYYARLAQRLIAALTVPTAAGSLYEVDMRLRPTGNKGPVAVSLEAFTRYHETEAWTWERLALTRARAIAGSETLRRKVEAVIRAALTVKTGEAKLIADARDMREKLAVQFPPRNNWDLKFARGGLVDIEFLAQTLQLVAAPDEPEVLDSNTIAAIERLTKAGRLPQPDAEALIDAAVLEQALSHVLRIALDATLDPATATPGLKALLVRAGDAKSFTELEERLANLQGAARDVFERLISV